MGMQDYVDEFFGYGPTLPPPPAAQVQQRRLPPADGLAGNPAISQMDAAYAASQAAAPASDPWINWKSSPEPTPDPWISMGPGGFRQDLTQGQVAQDAFARQQLDARHNAAIARIDRDAAMNDPMTKQIEAAKQQRAYEALQPYPSRDQSSIYQDESGTFRNRLDSPSQSQGEAMDAMRKQAIAEARDPRNAIVQDVQKIMDLLSDPRLSPQQKEGLGRQLQGYMELIEKMFGRQPDYTTEQPDWLKGWIAQNPGQRPPTQADVEILQQGGAYREEEPDYQ